MDSSNSLPVRLSSRERELLGPEIVAAMMTLGHYIEAAVASGELVFPAPPKVVLLWVYRKIWSTGILPMPEVWRPFVEEILAEESRAEGGTP